MKKKLLVLLLVLTAIVCFGVISASAEETHEHCVCGGTPVDAAHHSCADVTWEPLPEGTTDFGKLAAGNYYLTGDVEVTAVTNITKDVKICLNGHNITTSTTRVFGSPRTASGKLTVTDCSYDAATKTWGGTITGGNSTYGTILYTHYSSTTNIYGGNWTGRGEQNRMGGLIVVAQDGAPDTKDENGTVTLKGTSDPTKASTLNIYGGKIYGGFSGTGGNIHVMHMTKLNVYGGTITEGQAKFISWTASGSTSYKYGQGGNIYSDSGTTIKIYGGEISNGTCPHNGTIKSTYSAGSGGNIYANGDLFIYGGSIFGGHAQQNTLTSNGAYVKTNTGSTAAEIDGRGGNIYAVKNLTIEGGCIYDGKVNGLTGGNIYYTGGTGKLFTMSGGKIWGGEANADKDAAKSSGLVNAYDVCGGSIRIGAGTFEMTGGSIGIDADGKPAGGTCYPSGSEAGNFYAGSSSITVNLSGGEIAYGNILGVNEDGTLIKGLVSKGGNIGGSAKYTYSGDIIVRDGYAVNYGGNITLFNSGNTKIQGGTISGGEAKYGGNIAMSGSGTSVNVLEITGGTIKNGKATSNGGNVYVDLYKQLEITDGTFEGGKTSSDGGSIYGGVNTVITITDSTFDGGECTGSGGGNIYTTGVITMEKVTLKNGVSKYAGANFRVNSSDNANVTLTDCVFEGGNSGSYGGNAYIADKATITGCTFKNGNATTSGGNLSINGTEAVAIENCTFENGTVGTTGGNVYLTDASNVTLTNCSMSGGRADDGADKKVFTYGGNLYSRSKTLTIQGGTYENGAAQSAGNMYLGGTTATVTGVTFKNGDATLQCDGTTNGNGGNLQSTSSCALTVTGCTFEGGKAMRGGSIAAFGQMNLVDCTVGGGDAISGGGTVFVYQKGYINITGNTEIFGGKVTNSAATGGTININSFEAAKPNYIGDGVKIHSGTAYQGSGIYLADGVLALAGNVQIGNIWVYNMAETCYIDATDLNTTTPIQVAANYGKKIGISATDKSDMFTYVNGLVTYDNGDIKLVENAKINFSITLGGQREHSILLTNVGEMVMTIPDMTDCTVTYNGVVYTPDENGVITVTFPAGGRGAQYIITLTNNGEAGTNKKFVSTFAFAKGHMENPDTLVIGENTATLAAGNTTGYNYTYTAEKTGTLVITMPETGWMYVINNLTTYQYGDMQAYVDGAATAEIAITEGDELQIMVNTFDPTAPFAAPAGTITFTAKYADYVAEVGGVKYESLTEALAQGGTVTLLKDVTLTEKTTIEGTVTLNLGGKTLTTYAQNGNYGFVVKGDLTIEGEGNVVVNGVYGIGVLGSLTVNGGTFTTSADSDYMIGNFGTTTINGGTFTGIYCVLNNFSGTSTVTGGTFATAETDATGDYESSDLLADAGLTVTGGTFSKDVNEYCADGLNAFKAADGTYYISTPVFLSAQQNTVEVAGTMWYQGYFSGMEMTVAGEDFTVIYNGETLTPVEGTVTTMVSSANPRMPVVFAISGNGTYTANFGFPVGHMENPAALTIGTNTAVIAEGNNQGYNFTWTAEEDGTLTITMPAGDWMYTINNLTTYQYGDTQWSDSDPVVNPATVTVNKGDMIQLVVGSYNPADMWAAPAAELVIEASFEYAPGTAQNPIFVEWTWNEEQTEATASVTVPAGKTYNFAAYVSGMEMTINGEVYGMLNGSRWMPASFTITNDGAEAATYELKIYYPAGTQMNPAQLVIGENTATIAAGNNQGYFFTYTATETGALVITMPAGDWMYVINNMTTYQYGDMQWSDSDPVVNPAVVSVTEGDVLEIMVNSYDPANQWSNPAANITFTAATSQFIAQVGEKQYVDLATAVKEANGETVVLLQDLVLTEKLVLEGTATLDMNWCTITTAAVADNYSVIVKGDLTLDGYGTWNVNGVYGIGVTGTLTVNNGYFYASETNDYLIGNWGTTTVYGGGYYGIYCVINNFAGTTVIDGGEFNTEEFDYTGEYESCDVFADAGLTIYSGMFSKDVTEYCAEGKVCTDTGYGMYTVNDPVGTETNPVVFYDLENTVVNTGTMYYMTYSDGLIMTITGAEGYSLTIGGETIVPAGGVYTTVVTMEDFMPLTFAITGEGEFTVNFVYPIGAVENPDSLVIGENTTTVGENSWGYYYTWTATENGTLTITGTEGMQYNVNNLTSYVYGEYVYGAESYSVAVAAGDEIQVSVNTYNPESMWETPAGDITFTASFEGEGGSEPEGPVVGEGVVATPDEPIIVEYTAETAGVLSVTVSGTPGFKVEVYNADGETVGLPATGKAEETLTYELTAGTYTIRMVGYANWDEASATISYSISFTADEGGETEKAEYEVDYNTALVVGDNTITLLDTAITTIYAFEPTEEGTYTITAPEGAIVGYWGAGEWFLVDPMSTTNSTEWKCTGVGQAAYIGISGIEGEFTVTVEKTAEGQAPEQIEYAVYENVHTFPAGFNTLTGEETLLNVNVTEAHTAVLGTDGYYHLDSATGPVLYVDLSTDGFTIANAYGGFGANTLRGEVDGVKYDFKAAMEAYSTFEIYPLTEDLMKFIQGYGKYQGWFISGLSPFAEINEGTANADTAWMVLCRYVEVQEPEIEKFDIDVARMILGNALEFQFGVAQTKIPDTTGYYALIEKTWADGTTTTKTIPAEEWGKSGQYWAIVYDGLAAKEMGDTFYVTIYNADGVAVSNAREDSVRAYVERAYDSQKATGKTMMVDMLNYGAAAQVHFNYGTSDLANSKLTDAQKASGTAATPEMSNDQVKGTNYNGTRFILESRIQVQLAFKNMTSDMYAIYTYTNAAGKAQEVRVEGTDFVIIGGKPAGVELSALVYADARALVDVTVYNADGTVYGTATDSIESCSVRSGGDVFVALMKFADSAKAHLYG